MYLDHHVKKMYIVDYAAVTCESKDIEGDLRPYCLAEDASHIGNIVYGGTLKADLWEEQFSHGHQFRISLASHNNVPINVFARGGPRVGTVFEEYFDFKHGVEDPERIFEVPRICRHHNGEAPLSAEAKEDAKKATSLLSAFRA